MQSMESLPSNMPQNDEDLLQSAIDGLVGASARISIAMIVNMSWAEQHCEVISDEILVDHMDRGAKEMSSNDDEDEAIQHPFQSKTLCAIAVVKRYFVGIELLSDSVLAGLWTLQRMLRQNTLLSQRQLNLDDMLGCHN